MSISSTSDLWQTKIGLKAHHGRASDWKALMQAHFNLSHMHTQQQSGLQAFQVAHRYLSPYVTPALINASSSLQNVFPPAAIPEFYTSDWLGGKNLAIHNLNLQIPHSYPFWFLFGGCILSSGKHSPLKSAWETKTKSPKQPLKSILSKNLSWYFLCPFLSTH